MCHNYGAIAWQPDSALVEAYEAVADALAGDRVRIGDVLDAWRYLDALEAELEGRGVISRIFHESVGLTSDLAENLTKPDIGAIRDG